MRLPRARLLVLALLVCLAVAKHAVPNRPCRKLPVAA